MKRFEETWVSKQHSTLRTAHGQGIFAIIVQLSAKSFLYNSEAADDELHGSTIRQVQLIEGSSRLQHL